MKGENRLYLRMLRLPGGRNWFRRTGEKERQCLDATGVAEYNKYRFK